MQLRVHKPLVWCLAASKQFTALYHSGQCKAYILFPAKHASRGIPVLEGRRKSTLKLILFSIIACPEVFYFRPTQHASFYTVVKFTKHQYQITYSSPPHSSIRLAMVSASSSAILRILLSPSRTTCTTWASLTVSRLQKGGMTCCWIRYAT